jgi:molecular chaperone DnaJ
MKDYHKILGVNKNSTQEEIDKAYRSLVLKHHPDKNLGQTTDKFKQIQEAYEFLKNSKASFFSFNNKNSVDDIFDNIFSKFFGDQKINNNSSKVRLKISLEEAYKGCEKEVEVDHHKFCEICEGTGGETWISCSKCNGKGFIYKNESIVVQAACSFCDGKGNNIEKKCKDCNGNGFLVDEKKKIKVKIPSGIVDDTQIRLAGEGSGGGDLYVVVNVQKHSTLERQKNNLCCDFEVPYSILVLGGFENFDLFDEKIKVKIKPGTKTGSKIIIRNLGMTHLENFNLRGNLELTIQLKLPNKLTKEYKESIEKLKLFEDTIIQ